MCEVGGTGSGLRDVRVAALGLSVLCLADDERLTPIAAKLDPARADDVPRCARQSHRRQLSSRQKPHLAGQSERLLLLAAVDRIIRAAVYHTLDCP